MSDRAAFGGNYTEGDRGHQRGQLSFEHRAAIDVAQAGAGHYREPGEPLPLDEIAAADAAAWGHDTSIGRRDFASIGQRFLPLLVLGTLSAMLAMGLIGGFQFLVFAPASIEHKVDCSDHALDSNATSCVASKSDRWAILSTPSVQKVAAPAAVTGSGGNEPWHGITQQASESTHAVPLATQRNSISPKPRVVASQPEKKLPRPTPVPETKPGTIEGWTVREVVGGTAVLEGPGGQWRATSGDTVPGLGKVDSIVRWGSHWIVATSKGLVSTP